MAGFLGFGNFAKAGKGIKKEEKEKKRFFQFFDLFFRKLGKLVQLNLLFVLFCIPIVTIGPATAALIKIAKYYVEEKPVFLFSDFFSAFKENFLQGFLFSIIQAVVFYACFQGFLFYMVRIQLNWLYLIPLIFITLLAVILCFASFYAYMIMVSVQVKFFAVLKNSFMFSFIGAKTNFFTLIFSAIILVPSIVFFPVSIPFLLLISFSATGIIISFNSFQYIYKYLIAPYYFENGLENPYEKKPDLEDAIFEDTTK